MEDIVCQICNDGDYADDNLIVICGVFLLYFFILIKINILKLKNIN